MSLAARNVEYNKKRSYPGVLCVDWLLIGFGFVVAGGAGLVLAAQMAQGALDARGAVLGAMFAFIPAAALVGAGLYRRLRRPQPIDPGPSSVEIQRQLMDHLNARGQLSTAEMCRLLGVSEAGLKDLVDELIRLEIFTGHVDWDHAILYSAAEVRTLRSHNP